MYSRTITPDELAKMIDHTNLKPYATESDITKLCHEAIEHQFTAVCVNSSYVSLCLKQIDGADVEIAAVIGFPLGSCTTKAKAVETEEAISMGAKEIDMVMNVGFFRNKNYDYVKKDIEEVVNAAGGAKVKVILETGYLTDEQIVKACKLIINTGANFVKTSTGFGPMGAFVDHVKLMRKTVGSNFGVKAAGGIRDAKTAVRMINAGANRIGASSGIKIIDSLNKIIEDDGWFEETEQEEETIYSWSAANPKKQPKEVYDFYIEKRTQFYKYI